MIYGILGVLLIFTLVFWGRLLYGVTDAGRGFAKFCAISWLIIYPATCFVYVISYNGQFHLGYISWWIMTILTLIFLGTELRKKDIKLVDMLSHSNKSFILLLSTTVMMFIMFSMANPS